MNKSGPKKGSKHSEETKEKIRIALQKKKESGWDNHPHEAREKMRKAKLGKKRSKESIEKQFKTRAGYKHNNETIQKIKSGNTGNLRSSITKERNRKALLKRWKDPYDGLNINSKTNRERQSKFMKDGHAAHMNRFIKNPSKPQVKLYKMILEICPYAILNYPCLRYSIDIAIPFLNLAIEYDGWWWHQDKDGDKKRQEKIESEGWYVIRFKDYIPTLIELKHIFKEGCYE